MDYSAEKFNVSEEKAEEIAFTFEGTSESKNMEVSLPLRGVLNGLILSLPLWAAGFVIFKLF